MNNDAEVEQMIQKAGKTAPRVTPAQIDALVASLSFSTVHIGLTTTLTAAFLPNGFEVGVGKSACASPENFDAAIGEKIATDNARAAAREKLWELEGYVLKKQLSAPAPTFQERVINELDELTKKINALASFLSGPGALNITNGQRTDLQTQYDAMMAYAKILVVRIQKF